MKYNFTLEKDVNKLINFKKINQYSKEEIKKLLDENKCPNKLATLIIGLKISKNNAEHLNNLYFLLDWINYYYQDMFDVLIVEQGEKPLLDTKKFKFYNYIRYEFIYNPTEYNRGWLYNVAAKHFCSDSNTLVFMDTDVLPGSNFVDEIIKCNSGKYKIISPYQNVYYSTEIEKKEILKTKSLVSLSDEQRILHPVTITGGIVIFNKETYLKVYGFEQYIGWGGEDRALDALILELIPHDKIYIAPIAYVHLFHSSLKGTNAAKKKIFDHVNKFYRCSWDPKLKRTDFIHSNCNHVVKNYLERIMKVKAKNFGDLNLYDDKKILLTINGRKVEKLITVIIPVYNMEKYVYKSIKSVCDQTYNNIEIIVIDDGSTDNSVNIIKKLMKVDSRITLISKKNAGLGFARNEGIRRAKGEFITFLDSDDWFKEHILEKSMSKLVENDDDLLIFGWERIDESTNKVIAKRQDIWKRNYEDINLIKLVFSSQVQLMACAAVIKKTLFTDNNISFPNTFHEDIFVMPKIYFFAKGKTTSLKENSYKWLSRDGSITNSIEKKHLTGLLIAFLEWKSFLLNETKFELYEEEYVYAIYNFTLNYAKKIININDIALKNELFDFIKYIIKSIPEFKYYDKYFLEKGKIDKALLIDIVNEIYSNKLVINTSKKHYNIVFLPHKDYHVWAMGLIARELKKLGYSSCMLDLTDYYKDEGSRKKAKDFQDIPFLDYSILRDDKIDYDAMLCLNDWDQTIVKPNIIKAQKNNKVTIGIIEGINDFYDKDTGRERGAYQTVEYLFLTGKHDEQFFMDKKTDIVGIPRLKELLEEEVSFPQKLIALINVNFSYGVLENKRELWLKSAIEGCKKANIPYVITQHPADKSNLSNYNVSSNDMYSLIRSSSILISRFSSAILESLAMGKPTIYHNPHNEKALKFQEPLDAYSLSFDSDSLAKAIKYELSLNVDYRKRANKFLNYHCNINSEKDSALLAAESIIEIIEQKNPKNKFATANKLYLGKKYNDALKLYLELVSENKDFYLYKRSAMDTYMCALSQGNKLSKENISKVKALINGDTDE